MLYDMDRNFEAGLDAAAAALREGRLVGLPTETVYGLAADATNAEAIAAIFAAKERPRFNPLIVHVTSVAAARDLADLGGVGETLATAFWPGPLTLVAPRRRPSPLADLVTAGLDTVAVRVPKHPVAAALLGRLRFPLAAPSANPSGRVSATTAAHVAADLGDKAAVILDAGPAPIGLESTIVDVGREPTLLRQGAIPRTEIEAVIGRALRASGRGKPQAPGMLASHYAPRVALRVDAREVRPGESLLAFGAPLPPGAERAVAVVNLSAGGNLTEAAARFFATLRALDEVGAPIAAMPIPDKGLGEAINDRLRRAAAPRP
jgi:L-threonylcarbamoyladenylate synthase